MFKEMEEAFKEQVLSLIQNMNVENKAGILVEPSGPKQTLVVSHNEPKEFSDSKKDIEKNLNIGLPRVGEVKAGRNDPCPCGAINPATGEVYKWKKCGMINAPQHRKSLIN